MSDDHRERGQETADEQEGEVGRASGPLEPVGSARDESPPTADGSVGMGRRDFLRATGAGAGGLALAGSLGGVLSACEAGQGPGIIGGGPEIAVVGAGAFGVWTALALQAEGARVTLVDLYGPGNSRSTSGDETRGVRSSYAGRPVWTAWAVRAMERWQEFDAEFSPDMGSPVFYTTGDLIMRDTPEGMIDDTAAEWDAVGVEYERLDAAEIARRWPQINAPDMEYALFEPAAGVVRARATCRRAAQIFEMRGGAFRYARAEPGPAEGGRMTEISLDDGSTVGADLFVFALGPWFPKTFPELMGPRMRITTMGHVFYWGTPPGDMRFSVPNIPSWNVPGVTGWPSIPPDHRGFRLRTGGRSAEDPDTSVRWIPEQYMEQPRGVLEQYFPDIASQPLVETRACHYESSTSRDWIIDRHPAFDNVWLAGGGSAEGFKFGGVLGDFIAARVLDQDPYPELVDRFRLPELDEGDE